MYDTVPYIMACSEYTHGCTFRLAYYVKSLWLDARIYLTTLNKPLINFISFQDQCGRPTGESHTLNMRKLTRRMGKPPFTQTCEGSGGVEDPQPMTTSSTTGRQTFDLINNNKIQNRITHLSSR
jgi:hypothetical protein